MGDFMSYFIFGLLAGFLLSFLVLKRSINRAGAGELRMCRDRCPYYFKNGEEGEKDDHEC